MTLRDRSITFVGWDAQNEQNPELVFASFCDKQNALKDYKVGGYLNLYGKRYTAVNW